MLVVKIKIMTHKDSSELPVLDGNTIEELKEVMEDEFPDLVQTFLRDLPIHLDEIVAAIDGKNPEALRTSAHKLKSGSGSIGALQLAEIARQLEIMGRDGMVAGAEPGLRQLKSTAAQTHIALQALI